MYRHILVATNGSPLSMKAVRNAVKLAASLGARLTAVYVMPPFVPPTAYEAVAFHIAYTVDRYEKSTRKAADGILGRAVAAAGKLKCGTAVVADVDPWKGILDTARARKCDLVVMASHGRRGLAAVLLGSETQKVLAHAKLPVLVVR